MLYIFTKTFSNYVVALTASVASYWINSDVQVLTHLDETTVRMITIKKKSFQMCYCYKHPLYHPQPSMRLVIVIIKENFNENAFLVLYKTILYGMFLPVIFYVIFLHPLQHDIKKLKDVVSKCTQENRLSNQPNGFWWKRTGVYTDNQARDSL